MIRVDSTRVDDSEVLATLMEERAMPVRGMHTPVVCWTMY